MPDIDTTRELSFDRDIVPLPGRLVTWRSVLVILLLFTLVLMAVLPPLLNVNRFKRRIVTSISSSLGRPVHLDNVSLVLLPFPGFKLQNFVVAEDPAFGSEPVIHSNSVVATLRVSSLWSRRVEFSKIALLEPSINLVHISSPGHADRWNIESILLQAARIPAAPTAQARPSAIPRFPYIEATGARVNIKSGLEKLPFSLTEADFALWLPNPQQWRVRLIARPTRTDTNASDTGTISLEGSLGHAEVFDQVPIELAAEWKIVPLGEASRVLTGRDAGLRGDLRLNVSASGTIGSSLIKSTVDLRNGRRAAFVPDRLLDLHAVCQASAAATFHAVHQIRCVWPLPPSNSGAAPSVALTADVPDTHNPASASFEISSTGLPAAALLTWLRIASPRVPSDVLADGTLDGTVSGSGWTTSSTTGKLDLKMPSLAGGPLGPKPVNFGGLTIVSATLPPSEAQVSLRGRPPTQSPAVTFFLMPTAVPLGASAPATLDGRFDPNGYSLHLTGSVLPSRLLQLADALPQFGDGLRAVLPQSTPPSGKETAPHPELPIHVDLTSARTWQGGQSWSKVGTPIVARPSRRKH